jgi:phosphoribosylanthranilate isomerase
MSVRVKICGITNAPDARAALEAGADALGFVFSESSPRNVPLNTAREIISQLPPFAARVGVFFNPAEELVRQAITCGLDTLQFHGEESPEFCGRFGLRAIKGFRLQDDVSLLTCMDYKAFPWLLDSYVPGQPGGTGAVFNWELAVKAKKSNPAIILAGGLTPANVAEAVHKVRPYAVDVSSGVESAPGKKDLAKLRAFIAAAKVA